MATTHIISQLKHNKIQITQNKNPIPMDLFLSFFTVTVERFTGDYLGQHTGWTKYVNDSINFEIMGGICDGGHWLDRIEYGKNLQNGYNNYVNPFFLFPLFNSEGKKFFYEYYKDDIDYVLKRQLTEIEYHKKQLKIEKDKYSEMALELQDIVNQTTNL